MLLQQLVDYRSSDEEASRPYSRERIVHWELDVRSATATGLLVPLVGDTPAGRGPRRGVPKVVPHSNRTVGIAPALGADDIQYVLGWADDSSKPERVGNAHAAFVALAHRWGRDEPDIPLVSALTEFYARGGPNMVAKPDRWTSKDLVVIKVDGCYLTEIDSLWRLWSTVVEERKSGSTQDRGARTGHCLVCFRVGALLNRMPQAIPKALVPRADQEVALVSANKAIHTYDFSEGLATAPICTSCGQAAVANLHAILSADRHTFTYARQRTRLAWWVTNGGDPTSIEMLDAEPKLIDEYLRSVVEGRRPRRLESHEFCSVTVSGNVARLVVHDWIETPLGEVEESIRRWFDDQRTAHRWENQPAYFPLWRLIACAGQWQPNRDGAGGRYPPLFDKVADRPDDLAQALWRSALNRKPVPPYVLAHVVRRIRTDRRIDEPRAALLRLALTRHPKLRAEPIMSNLDEDSDNPSYLCGRLFAVLEDLQRAASGKSMPNTTFFDRYFAGAVANPRIAYIQGHRLAPAWLRKLEAPSRGHDDRTDPEASRKAGAARSLKDKLTVLSARLPTVPPARITTEEQARFILGYHHQRAHDLAQMRARAAAGDAALDVSQLDDIDTTSPPA